MIQPAPAPAAQKTYLVVDDEELIRKILFRYFGKKGVRVLLASDGQEALSLIERQAPDVVFLDIRMPGIDGLEVLRRARALKPKLTVLMVTAVEDEAIASRAMALGAKDYVLKPLDLDYLDTTSKALGCLAGNGHA